MNENKHTQGGIELFDENIPSRRSDVTILSAKHKYGIAKVYIDNEKDEEGKANAARIVHTWNCHDELVSALEGILASWENNMHGLKEEFKTYDDPTLGKGSYWSPAEAMVKSEAIAKCRIALQKASSLK